MSDKKLLTSEEISAIVDGFDPIDWEEMEMLRKKPLVHLGENMSLVAFFINKHKWADSSQNSAI